MKQTFTTRTVLDITDEPSVFAGLKINEALEVLYSKVKTKKWLTGFITDDVANVNIILYQDDLGVKKLYIWSQYFTKDSKLSKFDGNWKRILCNLKHS